MTLGLVLGSLTGLIVASTPAAAADGNILPPFSTGETWSVCEGYNHGTHTGTSAYGLDLVKNSSGSCDNSSSGATVKAPIDGTVYYYQASYGNLCVNIAGGRSYTLTHINSSITSGSVTAGQTVGTVFAAQPDPNLPPHNNNVAHIHFQMWSAPGCYNSSVMPFDSADGARICGAPDMTSSGPSGGNGTWSGTPFTGQNCGSSYTGDRHPVAFTAADGSLNVFANSSGDLYQNVWSPSSGWTGWINRSSAGGGFTGSPFELTAADGSLNFFEYSVNGHLWQNVWSSSGGWTGWIDRGVVSGGFVGSPSALVNTDGSLNVFGVGANGHLYQQVWSSSGGWSGWIDRGYAGSGLTGSPYALIVADGSLNVIVSAANGHVYDNVWSSSGGWTGLIDLGSVSGGFTGSPFVHVNTDGSLNIFQVNSGGHLWQNVWTSSGSWTGWIDRGMAGGGLTGSPYVAYSPDGSFNVIVNAANGHAYQNVWSPTGGGWTGWFDRGSVTGGFAGSPFAFYPPDGSLNIFDLANGHLWHDVWSSSGGWSGWIDHGTAGSSGF